MSWPSATAFTWAMDVSPWYLCSHAHRVADIHKQLIAIESSSARPSSCCDLAPLYLAYSLFGDATSRVELAVLSYGCYY
jgi:hypothetical protein